MLKFLTAIIFFYGSMLHASQAPTQTPNGQQVHATFKLLRHSYPVHNSSLTNDSFRQPGQTTAPQPAAPVCATLAEYRAKRNGIRNPFNA